MLPQEFAIGDTLVGPGHPTYVIAEAGANHNRDWETATKLIDVAVEAGADAVKFQTYSGASLYSTKTPRFKYLAPITDATPSELLEDISLPREWQPKLDAYARERGIHCRPLLISTGMAVMGEIEDALNAAVEGGAPAVGLMQCTSVYPAPAERINLRAMATMERVFGVPVGLS
jgi:sialic acid synthase SpsE